MMERLFKTYSEMIFKLLLICLISTFILHPYSLTAGIQPSSASISPELYNKINSVDSELFNVVAFLVKDENKSILNDVSLLRKAREVNTHSHFIKQLQKKSSSKQDIQSILMQKAAEGSVTNIKDFWITEAVSFKATSEVIAELSNNPAVELIIEDKALQLIEPTSLQHSESNFSGSSDWVELTGIRDVWTRGYTGRGRLVCNFDTGVEGTHPALANSWLGNNGALASESWFDPYNAQEPVDLAGHGTHTMGIMVGRDGSDTIGVAFNANWIAAAVIDRGQSLNKTISDILAAFEWAADPDGNPNTSDDVPDVVCNSWGIPAGLFEPCDATFWQAIDNLEALGVVVIFACGNEGPNPGTIRNPADRSSNPSNSFSVGSIDQHEAALPIAHFSSRGPSSCDPDKVKPEIVAPGVGIRSSYKGNTYKEISGTSMSAPIVAGCVALMREYNPNATVAEIKNALLNSVTDLGAAGKDNNYGWGFINVATALEYLPEPTKPNLSFDDFSFGESVENIILPGNTTELNISAVNNIIPAAELWGRITCQNQNVALISDSAYFGSANIGEVVENSDEPFLIKLDHEVEEGTLLEFSLNFYGLETGYINTVDFSLIAGQPANAEFTLIETNRLGFEVSNFALGHKLLDYEINSNLLSHISFLFASDDQKIYDAIPGNLDFLAENMITAETYGLESNIYSQYKTTDNQLQIIQHSRFWDEPSSENFIINEYQVTIPQELESDNFYSGLALDVNFENGELNYIYNNALIIRNSSGTNFIGIKLLSDSSSYITEIDGFDFKSGSLDDSAKYNMITQDQTNLATNYSDKAVIIGSGPNSADGDNQINCTVAIAIGSTEEELLLALERSEQKYNAATDTDDGKNNLPVNYTLQQNYPNPFNNTTNIEFSLPATGNYQFTIYNTLGQTIKTISVENASAGVQTVNWDGTNSKNDVVASGIYFYKLSFAGNSLTRKMVLLK